jgi:hypothetical protein
MLRIHAPAGTHGRFDDLVPGAERQLGQVRLAQPPAHELDDRVATVDVVVERRWRDAEAPREGVDAERLAGVDERERCIGDAIRRQQRNLRPSHGDLLPLPTAYGRRAPDRRFPSRLVICIINEHHSFLRRLDPGAAR